MPQKCRVCSHPKTKAIEEAIVRDQPHTQIAKQFGIHFQSVRYHAENHLPEKLVQAVQDKEEKHAENILDGINDLLSRTKKILKQAEGNDQNRLALDAIKEARSTYELLSKIAVKLEEYRRRDEEKKTDATNEFISKGLKVLSNAELKTLIQLVGKIHASDPDYELNQTSRLIVESMGGVQESYGGWDDSDSPRNSPSEDKNTRKYESDEDLEDWLDDDLDLELDDTIPSEDTDPDWKRRDRNHRRW